MKKYLLLASFAIAFCALKAEENQSTSSAIPSTKHMLPTSESNRRRDASEATKQVKKSFDDHYDIDNTIPRPNDACRSQAAVNGCEDLVKDQEMDLKEAALQAQK